MSKYGYISIHRQIRENWIWEPKPFDVRSAWIDIIMSASYHDSKLMIGGSLIEVPRGTWFVSIGTLASRWGWSRNRVEHFLGELSRDEMVVTKGTARGTLVTVVNYEKFQGQGEAKGVAEGEAEGVTEGVAKGVAEGEAKGEAEGVHSNNINKGNKGNKLKRAKAFLSKCEFTEEEGDRFYEMVQEGRTPFPNEEIADAYWKEALRRRNER